MSHCFRCLLVRLLLLYPPRADNHICHYQIPKVATVNHEQVEQKAKNRPYSVLHILGGGPNPDLLRRLFYLHRVQNNVSAIAKIAIWRVFSPHVDKMTFYGEN